MEHSHIWVCECMRVTCSPGTYILSAGGRDSQQTLAPRKCRVLCGGHGRKGAGGAEEAAIVNGAVRSPGEGHLDHRLKGGEEASQRKGKDIIEREF